jgi:enediyne biosynthesis protein E4
VTTLYRNNGDGSFHDASMQAGLGINTRYVGFGVGFFDFDNDGRKDIFIANGHVYPQIANRKIHLTYRQPRLLYRNLGGGRFADVSASAGPAITTPNLGRGCAFGDLNNDGRVDIVVNNLDGAPSVLHNDEANSNNWLIVKCLGTRSNRSAIGARVRVVASGRAQIDEVLSGSGYYSQNDLRLHFGLGAAAVVELVEVKWPSGAVQSLRGVKVNQVLRIEEGRE